jgi:hypothetical protein
VECPCVDGTLCSATGSCCEIEQGISAYDATPGGTAGQVCDEDKALVADADGCGLDCAGAGVADIAGQGVTACVGVDFGNVAHRDPVIVRARAVDKACSVSCSGADCDVGKVVAVFFGEQKGSYRFAATVELGAYQRDHAVVLGSPARFVVACRKGWGASHPDVMVDSITRPKCP